MDLEELELQLPRIRDKRGCLLPHHGLMATALPAMLNACDEAAGVGAKDDCEA